MIKTNNLCKSFNGQQVLKDLSLNIAQGEFYCLLGPNGAGKTTTLKLLVGLLRPTSGQVSVAGFDIAGQPLQAKRLLGFIPDSPFLYENLTGQEFIEFVGQAFCLKKAKLDQQIEHYLELFGLKDAADTLLRDYSHGMRQKIIYISNLIHDPQVLLIDEPLVGLDPQAIHLVKNLLRQKAKSGMTVLMCTHLLQIAEELADRVGILNKGQLVVEGTMDNLRKNIQDGSLEEIFLKLLGK